MQGTCNTSIGALVCTSGVCSPTDNHCGYVNGEGPCTQATKYVCRSTVCSSNGKCMDGNQCLSDSDCPSNLFCYITGKYCMQKVLLGRWWYNDPDRLSPIIDGTCNNASASIVCESGVCSPSDGACGYQNGEGNCTKATAQKICREQRCSVTGVCSGQGFCVVDADCPTGF